MEKSENPRENRQDTNSAGARKKERKLRVDTFRTTLLELGRISRAHAFARPRARFRLRLLTALMRERERERANEVDAGETVFPSAAKIRKPGH